MIILLMEVSFKRVKKTYILIAFFMGLLICAGCSRDEEVIINRYRNYLFDTSSIDSTNVSKWLRSLGPAGRWPDIDYTDQERANWNVKDHLVRTRALALAWANPASPRYHEEVLWKAISRALGDWLDQRYQNSNWWHNQIGVPRYMRDIIILLGDALSARQKQGALEVLAQFKLQKSGAGANLIWSADLGLHYAALTKNNELLERCRELILQEINITKGEGVQPDFSFHQHGSRLQMYQYGRAFLLSSVRLAWETRGTSLAFPQNKEDILTNFVIKGWQWMTRGLNTVPGTMDRSATRVGELRHSTDLRSLVPYLCDLDPQHSKTYREIARRQNGKGKPLEGFRYYPYSDFSTYHRKAFSFFLKTISDRTLATESFNGENLKGKLLNSGDSYLVSDGDEYYNLMPLWDWTKLPGVTSFKGADHIERKPYVGSVGDGSNGLTAMDYQMTGVDSTRFLSAHKIWARQGNVVVALIAAVKTKNIQNYFTALDQCRWQGEVTVNKPAYSLQAGNHQMNDVRWIHHNNFAYIPLSPSSFSIQLKTKTGRWTSINTSEPEQPVTDRIFLPVMEHREKSTGYVLAYASTPQRAAEMAQHPSWQIVKNDPICQAVRFRQGPLMAAFFSPGSLETKNYGTLRVNKACLVMLKEHKVYASDPAHKGGTLNLQLTDERSVKLELPGDGSTVVLSL